MKEKDDDDDMNENKGVENDNDNDNNNDNDECIKMVLVGETGVGKTSIISQYSKGLFNPELMSTNGATFTNKKKVFKDIKKSITFEIWDTAGQEKYRSLAKNFFKDSLVVLIVYDISNKSSFEEVKNYWMNLVKENVSNDIIIYLVGNKNDLFGQEAVKEEEAKQYAQEQNIFYWKISAKTSTGIDELFEDIGKKCLSPEFINSEENQNIKQRKYDIKIKKEGNNQDNKDKSQCIC